MKHRISVSRVMAILLVLVISLSSLVSVTATGCAGSQTSTPTNSELNEVVITLERTACKGTCPVYKVTINGNGTVVYEGRDFVKTTGRVESTISDEKIKQLVSEFNKIDYFSLNDSYVERVITDAPSAITSITLGGKTKTIKHYHGDLNAPKELTELEDRIDETVNSAQWIE